MSQKWPNEKRPVTNRGSRRASRKLHLGVIAPIVIVLVVVGVVLTLHFTSATSASPSQTNPRMGTSQAVGLSAPDGALTTTSRQQLSIASFRGKPTLIWFVATWCSSCQAGTQSLAANISQFSADGVRVVEVELYKDLGQSGPDITTFGKRFAGKQYSNPDWTFAKSSKGLTQTYDPKSYLDIYYLLNSKGQITYVNGSPGSTMAPLLSQAANIA